MDYQELNYQQPNLTREQQMESSKQLLRQIHRVDVLIVFMMLMALLAIPIIVLLVKDPDMAKLSFALSDALEDFGFEYTGEQNYLDKEKSVLDFRYVYRRKK